MAHYSGKHFKEQTETIDGNSYDNCTFVGCRIIYRGGAIPMFSGCNLDRCTWIFEDAAKRTTDLMRGVYSGMGPGGRELIEQMCRNICTPFPKPPAR